MKYGEIVEYRMEHLRERLAREDIAELGVRVELRGGRAVVLGSVAAEEIRAAVLRIAAEELAGLEWSEDLTVTRSGPPDHTEELS